MLNTTTASTLTIPGPGPMLPHPARILEIKQETGDVTTYAIAFEDESLRAGYRFLPGQFNMLYLPGVGEVPISMSSDAAEPGTIGHTIRLAGNVTRAIGRLSVGDALGVRGPFGSAWPMDDLTGADLCIVTGGIGLAPLRPAIYHIIRHRERYGKVYLLYGARTPKDMLYVDEFDAWRARDIEILLTVDRADPSWKGNVGVVPMLFYHLRLNPKKTAVLTCGPEIMMYFVVFESLARRIPKERIFVSMERNMKCAIGFCGHCQYGPTFVCKDGPVYDFATIEPFFGVEEF